MYGEVWTEQYVQVDKGASVMGDEITHSPASLSQMMKSKELRPSTKSRLSGPYLRMGEDGALAFQRQTFATAQGWRAERTPDEAG